MVLHASRDAQRHVYRRARDAGCEKARAAFARPVQLELESTLRKAEIIEWRPSISLTPHIHLQTEGRRDDIRDCGMWIKSAFRKS